MNDRATGGPASVIGPLILASDSLVAPLYVQSGDTVQVTPQESFNYNNSKQDKQRRFKFALLSVIGPMSSI